MKNHHFIKKATKGNKYGAIKCSHDGYKFDSLKEGDEYLKLRLRLQGGDICGLIVHPKYPIVIHGKLVCTVILDFSYLDCLTGIVHYIDVKGFDKKTKKFRVTSDSRTKKNLLEAWKQLTVEYI